MKTGPSFVLALAVALLGHGAEAQPRSSTAPSSFAKTGTPSFFLGADPHVPLAVVAGGRITSAVARAARGTSCGSRTRWAQLGSKWLALDGWGQAMGAT